MTVSRRQVLAIGAVGLGAVKQVAWPRVSRAGEPDDDEIVAGLLAREREAVAAYDALGSGVLEREIRGHHDEAARVWVEALEERGADVPGRGAAARTGGGADAIEIEERLLAAYAQAISLLGTARLLQTAASLMAAQGQHLVALRTAAGNGQPANALEPAVYH